MIISKIMTAGAIVSLRIRTVVALNHVMMMVPMKIWLTQLLTI